MPPIIIKINDIRNINANVKKAYINLSNEKDGLSSLRLSIDSKILARRNIGSRLSQANNSLDELEKRLMKLEKFVDQSMNRYSTVENQLTRLALSQKILQDSTIKYLNFSTRIVKMKDAENWKHKDTSVKESFFGMTDFDWLTPFTGTNLFGTILDALVASNVGYRVLKGFEVVRKNNGKVLIKSDNPTPRKKSPKGRPRAKYKIFDDSYIHSQAKLGNYVEAAGYSNNLKVAVGATVKDKLGWISIGFDITADIKENLAEDASKSKIAGDILGNVAVGVGAIAVAGATVALLPAAAGVATITAVGLGVSVGVTYITEGIKWNVDLDKDGEDDNMKDVVKTGFKKGIDTVAGWLK